MPDISKGKSPFYPGQPVPVELFVGRSNQIQRILDRGVSQVAQGKQASVFVQGHYGIGKTSIASYVRLLAERDFGLHSIYVSLGGVETLDDLKMELEVDPHDLRDLFLQHDFISDYELKWHEPDREELIEFLAGEHDFSEDRVINAINKLKKLDNSQSSLEKWL